MHEYVVGGDVMVMAVEGVQDIGGKLESRAREWW